ncbi:unnamed protein product, partial [marine sediment metagenome]
MRSITRNSGANTFLVALSATISIPPIKPDIMTVAKGITSAYFPLGVVVFNDRVYQGVRGVITSGFTYDGHPVGCAVATKTMEIYVRDKIAEKVTKVSKHLIDRLNAEFLPLPCVGEVTGLGLMG